mmetsp:Transcript_24020/g.52426  ORF Transcript_24020/g.52426 Transcript_24020/m.52426 type:complete len:239 (+) Transcript_24020:929-1645(+)
MGRLLMRGRQPFFLPCTALGCLELLSRSGIAMKGMNTVVLGNSNTIGMPISVLLRDHGVASVKVIHDPVKRRTDGPSFESISTSGQVYDPCRLREEAEVAEGVPEAVREADLVVVAVGVPNLVKRDWVRPGAVVLDVGINPISVDESAADVDPTAGPGEPPTSMSSLGFHVVGDVAYEEVAEVASAITPVPGGVGPMTVAALLHNVIFAAKLSNGVYTGHDLQTLSKAAPDFADDYTD